jgi:hypothetical protein
VDVKLYNGTEWVAVNVQERADEMWSDAAATVFSSAVFPFQFPGVFGVNEPLPVQTSLS